MQSYSNVCTLHSSNVDKLFVQNNFMCKRKFGRLRTYCRGILLAIENDKVKLFTTALVIVILSVRPPSVCPSVTLVDCVHVHGSTYDHDFFTMW